MTRFERFLRNSIIVCLFLLLVLSLSPGVGWIVRRSISSVYSPGETSQWESYYLDSSKLNEIRTASLDRILTEQGSDIEIAYAISQMKSVNNSSPVNAPVNRRKTLVDFCKSHPTYLPAIASLVRLRNMGEVKLDRQESGNVTNSVKPEMKDVAKSSPKIVPPDPEILAQYDNLCSGGEKLDPTNGFFPTMRAIGLFEANRDDEAVAALHRSASMKTWNDYTDVEVKSTMKVHKSLYRNLSAIDKTTVAYSVLFPHFASLRAMSRQVTNMAIQRERAGDFEGGLRLRRDFQRICANLRVNSKSLIGDLTAFAMFQIVTARPGGAPAPVNALNGKTSRITNIPGYIQYLNDHGYPDEGKWVSQELAAQNTVRAIYAAYSNTPAGDYMSIYRLIALWAVVRFIIIYIFWSLVLAVTSQLYIAHRVKREKSGFKSHDRYVVGASIVLVLALIVTLGFRHTEAVSQSATAISMMMGNPNNSLSNGLAQVIAFGAIFGLAGLVFVASAIYALAVRKPAGKVIAGAMRAFCVCNALLFTLALAVLSGYTSVEEKKQSAHIDASIVSEIKLAAKTIGKPLPGFVAEPTAK